MTQQDLDEMAQQFVALACNEAAPKLTWLQDEGLPAAETALQGPDLPCVETTFGQWFAWCQANKGCRFVDEDNNPVNFPITN